MVGRWSIPLAFLIPGLVVLAENLFVRGLSDFFVPESGVRGGFVLNYLRQRATFSIEDHQMFKRAFTENEPLDVVGLLNNFVAQIDWVQMGSGLIVAALLVYVASEYRRRVTLDLTAVAGPPVLPGRADRSGLRTCDTKEMRSPGERFRFVRRRRPRLSETAA